MFSTMSFRSFLCILGWMLLLPLQLFAQYYTVRGRVVDKYSRQPVPYANVSLYGQPGQGASTDSLGVFRIERVSPGIHQLSVSCIG